VISTAEPGIGEVVAIAVRQSPSNQGAGIFEPLLTNYPIALGCQVIHFGQHPCQKLFGRDRAYPCPLERLDLATLAVDLPAPIFDILRPFVH
jgi:hypothetical protein